MAAMKWRTHRKHLTQTTRWLWFHFILPGFSIPAKLLSFLWRRIRQDKQFAVVLFSTIALILFLIVFGILPTSQPFEGSLLVRSLSFTNSDSDRLLLKDVRDLQEISISGIQKFTLAGTIRGKDKIRAKFIMV
jgi:hypothetical protein